MAHNFKFEVRTSAGTEIEPVFAESLALAEDIARSNNFGKGYGELDVKRFKGQSPTERNKRSAKKLKAQGYNRVPMLVHDDDVDDLREYGQALITLRGDFE